MELRIYDHDKMAVTSADKLLGVAYVPIAEVLRGKSESLRCSTTVKLERAPEEVGAGRICDQQ